MTWAPCDYLVLKYQNARRSGIKGHRSIIDSSIAKVSQLVDWDNINKFQMELVIAHYQENLDWSQLYHNFRTIYTKGSSSIDNSDNILISLPNIGRESHTYLHHIVTNWDQLAERTVFTQGNPFEHEIMPFNYYFLTQRPVFFLEICRRTNAEPHWGRLQHWGKWRHDLQTGKMRASSQTLGQWWDHWIQKPRPRPEDFKWSPGATFSLHRNIITSQPLAYYQQLLDSLTSLNHSNPEEGHYFERSWSYIFSPPLIAKNQELIRDQIGGRRNLLGWLE